MEKILNKQPKVICEEILDIAHNNTVNIEIVKNSKSSLYVFLNNTIYITNEEKQKKDKQKQEKSKLLIIAHECAHSLQSKKVQLINFILANLEMLLFAIVIGFGLFFEKSMWLVIGYIVVAACSMFIRLYLEMNATINSVKITAKYLMQNAVPKCEIKELVKYYKKELLKTLPLFIMWLYIFKIIRIMLVIVI